MSIRIILASHGLYAQEARNTCELIIGDAAKCADVISVTADKSYDQCLKELNELYESYEDKENGVLILTDIFGGTPANISTYLAVTNPDVVVYSGFNMPVLIELFMSNPKNLDEAKSIVENTYEASMVCISDKLKESGQGGDQMDTY